MYGNRCDNFDEVAEALHIIQVSLIIYITIVIHRVATVILCLAIFQLLSLGNFVLTLFL